MILCFFVGGVLLARFVPPWVAPADGAAAVAAVYQEHANRIRVGMILMMLAFGVMAPWGASIAAQLRRREGEFPILAYTQLTCIAAGTAMILAVCVFVSVAAFRPGDTSPQITQLCSDVAYLFFLCTWPPFTVWCTALGAAILMDPVEGVVYPRWSGYLTIWAGLLFVPGGMISIFKSGMFAWTGLLAMYVPLGAFLVWVVTMTVLTINNVKAGAFDEDRAKA
jgi:hypothetical protein